MHLWSRNGRDWSVEFPGITAALKAWKLKSFVLDGEACACDESGWPDFNALLGGGAACATACFHAFDLLELWPRADRHRRRVQVGHNAPKSTRRFKVLCFGRSEARAHCFHQLRRVPQALGRGALYDRSSSKTSTGWDNHLAGRAGDAANAVLAALGYNFGLLLRWLALLLRIVLTVLAAPSHSNRTIGERRNHSYFTGDHLAKGEVHEEPGVRSGRLGELGLGDNREGRLTPAGLELWRTTPSAHHSGTGCAA